MIKVNLLPQRRAKVRAAADPSAKQAVFGVAALALAAVAVFFLLDMPRRSRLNDLKAANAQLDTQIAEKQKQLVGYAELKKAEEEANRRADSITRLLGSKVVPAHILHELGKVLTREGPTMTEEMARAVGTGPDSNPNKQFQNDWDPSHVWMSAFVDQNGVFRLEGGAQSESDVTQLSKRLAASVYFLDVTPAGGERVVDRETNLNYYKYTITGRLAY
ncbi:MAG: Fimbrial assembly family protein [Myxococcales bacterium]|nr:Fimbrial assembly family protein [Myxococcales bacterium]